MTPEAFGTTFVVTCALVLGAPTLDAQQPRADSTPRDTLRRYALSPIVVTASVVPTAQQEVGFATSAVALRDLVVEPAPYAERALSFLPGASIDEASGPGGPTVLHLRGGNEPFTQMLFDGVPINISGGFNDIDGLLLTNVERIEVARGPMSALWGSSAMAGAVQFITREGQAGPTRVEVRIEGGGSTARGGEARSEITASGGSERLRWSSGLGFAYDRGVYALPNDLRTGDLSLRLDAAPAPQWTVTATARYMAIQTHLPVRDPGATRVPLDPNQRDGRHRWLGSLSTGWAASPTWHHRLTAALLWDDFVYRDARDSTLNPAAYPFFVFNFDLEARSTLLRPSLEYVGSNELSFAGSLSRLALAYGARWQREMESSSQAGDFGPAQTFFGRNNSALFTEVQSQVGPISVLAGARVEKFQGLPAALLPRASVVVSLVPDRLSLRATAGRAFTAPNVDQQYLDNPATVPNPNLRPASSVSWEVGATLTGRQRAFTVGVGYFHQRYDDLIQTVAADTGAKQTNKNLSRTQASGVELELERRWSGRWRTGGNLAWVTTEVLDNAGLDPTDYPVGGSLPAVPRLTGNVYVEADLSRSVTTLARLAVVGRQTVFTERFAGQRVETAAYSLLELSVGWRLTSALEVYSRLENLLNTRYITAYDRPGQPRTVALGLRARFNQ
jgi:vitamin B12 transporter